jgi:hypothetical protein
MDSAGASTAQRHGNQGHFLHSPHTGQRRTPIYSRTEGGGVPKCPATEMFVSEGKQVGDLLPGDILDCTDGKHAIETVEISQQPCTRIWTEAGHELITSDSTPFHLPNGLQVIAGRMDGQMVLTDTGEGSAKVWLPCHAESVSARAVNQIYAGDRIFAAGTSAGARIYSHNLKPVQPYTV